MSRGCVLCRVAALLLLPESGLAWRDLRSLQGTRRQPAI